MPEPCLFCDNPAGSREHLWPKWIHDRHDFGPIHHKVGDREEMTLPNPQLTAKTVCGQCNNGWMSRLEAENIPVIGSMFQDLHIPLDRQQQESVSVWALKTAMILDSVQGRKAASRFYRSDECKNLRIHRAIPSRTLVVIARVSASLLIAKGYKFDRYPPGREWNVDGICGTVVVGPFVVQVVTLRPDTAHEDMDLSGIRPLAGDWENMTTPIWPIQRDSVSWPPRISFTNGPPRHVENLIGRWRIGINKRAKRSAPADSPA